jgi:nucleoside-diphosphate-sugar epimerase
VDDQVRGLLALERAEVTGPVNIGNPAEITILDLVSEVLAITGSASPVVFEPLPLDDPARRRTADWLAGQLAGA